jgi:hypothetical protein
LHFLFKNSYNHLLPWKQLFFRGICQSTRNHEGDEGLSSNHYAREEMSIVSLVAEKLFPCFPNTDVMDVFPEQLFSGLHFLLTFQYDAYRKNVKQFSDRIYWK